MKKTHKIQLFLADFAIKSGFALLTMAILFIFLDEIIGVKMFLVFGYIQYFTGRLLEKITLKELKELKKIA